MSHVSGLTLVHSCAEDQQGDDGPYDLVLLLNAWLTEKGFQPLEDLSGQAVGSKHPQTAVYIAGYNYFPEDEFAEKVLSLEWRSPENVVLVIQPDDGATRVWRPEAAKTKLLT